MFKLSANPRYSWPVSVEIPADGGTYDEAAFTVVFRRGTVEEYQALYKRMETGELNFVDAAKEVVLGWDEVVDDGGEPIAFTPQALDGMLQVPRVAEAIFWAYIRSASGNEFSLIVR
jgi:hypothetical protein